MFKFKYNVITTDESGKETVKLIEHAVDPDWVLVSLQASQPTAFKEYKQDADGNAISGLQMVVASLATGAELPTDLPSFSSFMASVKRIFELPDDFGMRQTLALLKSFIVSVGRRAELKKDIADSQNSCGSTPAASDGTTSPQSSESVSG